MNVQPAASTLHVLVALLISVLLSACGSGSDGGDPLSATGDVEILTERYRSVAPNDGLESDSVFFLIPEKKEYELTTPVSIDGRAADTLDESETLIEDSLAAGTTVDSYLLHFDRVGSSSRDVQLRGELNLPGRLLGIITTGEHLDATDGELGVRRIQYPEPGSYRPVEIGRTKDQVIIGPERRTLELALRTNASADQMRILIASE